MSGYDYMVEKSQWKKGVAQFDLGELKMCGIESQWHPCDQGVSVKLYCEVGSSAHIVFKVRDFDQPVQS